jgi:hypothetical protein
VTRLKVFFIGSKQFILNYFCWSGQNIFRSFPFHPVSYQFSFQRAVTCWENLKPRDITSLRQALYRERQKQFPKLPSSIEVSDVLNFLKPINTSKDEDLLLVNDADSRTVRQQT